MLRHRQGQEHKNEFSEQLVMFESLTFLLTPMNGQDLNQEISSINSTEISTQLHEMLNQRSRRLSSPHTRSHFEITPENTTLYACIQSIMKLHPMFDRAIAEILEHDKEGLVLLLSNEGMQFWMDKLQRRLQAYEGSNEWADRVLFLPQMQEADYQIVVCGAHVNLDPFPFGGGVTLTDALGCPIPVPFVSVGDLQSVHHLGSGIASALNLSSELVVSKEIGETEQSVIKKFAMKAVSLARRQKDEDMILSHRLHECRRKLWEGDLVEAVVKEWEVFLLRI